MPDIDARGSGGPARAHAPGERPGPDWERGRLARERSRSVREHSRSVRERSRAVLERLEVSHPSLAQRARMRGAGPGPAGLARDGGVAPAALAGRLVAAQEEERRRISLELHDSVSQRIAVACIALGRLRDGLRGPASVQASDILEVLAEVAAEVRQVSHAMHPPVLELAGLAAALRQHCAELRRLARLEVEVIAGALPPLPREVGLCLYRVAQEALGNVAAHSGACRASVRVSPCESGVELEVRDAGLGFDPARVRDGLGLVGMHERVRLLRGTLAVETRAGAGTLVRARLPVGPAAAAGPAG